MSLDEPPNLRILSPSHESEVPFILLRREAAGERPRRPRPRLPQGGSGLAISRVLRRKAARSRASAAFFFCGVRAGDGKRRGVCAARRSVFAHSQIRSQFQSTCMFDGRRVARSVALLEGSIPSVCAAGSIPARCDLNRRHGVAPHGLRWKSPCCVRSSVSRGFICLGGRTIWPSTRISVSSVRIRHVLWVHASSVVEQETT